MRKFFTLLFLLPLVTAGLVVEDPVGDVEMGSYDQTVPSPYPWTAVDMTAISVEEDADNFYWTVTIVGPPTETPGGCLDAGDLRTFFRYGEARYHVQQGIDLQCVPYGVFWETFQGDFSRRFISELDVDVSGNDITVTIPKELILDEGGAPPIEGRILSHIRGRSFNMFSLGGPDIRDPFNAGEGDTLVVNDDIPDLASDAGSYQIQSGGISYSGDIRLWSERPFRSSNGGDGVFLYDMILDNFGPATEALLSLINVPDEWHIAGPTRVLLEANSTYEFQLAVQVPFRHQHGGTDAMTVRLENAESWAQMEVGISYLNVPQPAGHHNEVYLHATGFNGIAPFAGGGTFFMNTTESEAATTMVGEQFNGPTGTMLRWHACLEGDLKLGLNFTQETGLFEGLLTNPMAGRFSGRLVHLGAGVPLQVCHPSFFGDRAQTDLAVIVATDIAGPELPLAPSEAAISTNIVPLVDLMPYESGSTLYLELTLEHGSANVASAYQTGLMEGVKLTLPLSEYNEGTVVGAIGKESPAELSDVDGKAEPEVQESPLTIAFLLPLGLLALAARKR